MSDPFADVKRRHPDIPQEPLPFELPQADGTTLEPTARRSAPSLRWAMCPECVKDKPTGVVRDANGDEVFRPHNKVLTTGRRIRCNGTGMKAPP